MTKSWMAVKKESYSLPNRLPHNWFPFNISMVLDWPPLVKINCMNLLFWESRLQMICAFGNAVWKSILHSPRGQRNTLWKDPFSQSWSLRSKVPTKTRMKDRGGVFLTPLNSSPLLVQSCQQTTRNTKGGSSYLVKYFFELDGGV